MMHTRRWIRRGVAGMGLSIPLALAPGLDITVRAADPVVTEVDQMANRGAGHPGNATTCAGARQPDEPCHPEGAVHGDGHLRLQRRRQAVARRPVACRSVHLRRADTAGGSRPFRYARATSLPERSDGRFETGVTVSSIAGQPAARRLAG